MGADFAANTSSLGRVLLIPGINPSRSVPDECTRPCTLVVSRNAKSARAPTSARTRCTTDADADRTTPIESPVPESRRRRMGRTSSTLPVSMRRLEATAPSAPAPPVTSHVARGPSPDVSLAREQTVLPIARDDLNRLIARDI